MYYHMATQTLTLIIVCSLADRNPDGGINATNHSDGIGLRAGGTESVEKPAAYTTIYHM